eukprot:3254572-Pyramimonas_sp.AAC.1
MLSCAIVRVYMHHIGLSKIEDRCAMMRRNMLPPAVLPSGGAVLIALLLATTRSAFAESDPYAYAPRPNYDPNAPSYWGQNPFAQHTAPHSAPSPPSLYTMPSYNMPSMPSYNT